MQTRKGYTREVMAQIASAGPSGIAGCGIRKNMDITAMRLARALFILKRRKTIAVVAKAPCGACYHAHFIYAIAQYAILA